MNQCNTPRKEICLMKLPYLTNISWNMGIENWWNIYQNLCDTMKIKMTCMAIWKKIIIFTISGNIYLVSPWNSFFKFSCQLWTSNPSGDMSKMYFAWTDTMVTGTPKGCECRAPHVDANRETENSAHCNPRTLLTVNKKNCRWKNSPVFCPKKTGVLLECFCVFGNVNEQTCFFQQKNPPVFIENIRGIVGVFFWKQRTERRANALKKKQYRPIRDFIKNISSLPDTALQQWSKSSTGDAKIGLTWLGDNCEYFLLLRTR